MTESERYGLSLSAPRLESHLPLQYFRHTHKTTTVLTVLVRDKDASAGIPYRSAQRCDTQMTVFPSPFLIRSVPQLLPGAPLSFL